mmetsp:Transcript_30803/g.77047  ORF Transcript_30803/g.77047 Transcript_30803/m.77047 type:complete len:229 (+) Transcript_30803:325-1011(+)
MRHLLGEHEALYLQRLDVHLELKAGLDVLRNGHQVVSEAVGMDGLGRRHVLLGVSLGVVRLVLLHRPPLGRVGLPARLLFLLLLLLLPARRVARRTAPRAARLAFDSSVSTELGQRVALARGEGELLGGGELLLERLLVDHRAYVQPGRELEAAGERGARGGHLVRARLPQPLELCRQRLAAVEALAEARLERAERVERQALLHRVGRAHAALHVDPESDHSHLDSES